MLKVVSTICTSSTQVSFYRDKGPEIGLYELIGEFIGISEGVPRSICSLWVA